MSFNMYSPTSYQQNPHLDSLFRMTNFSQSSPTDYITTQDRNYLKMRNEELNKELLTKINEVQHCHEKIKSLEMIVINLQKTIHGYHEKLAQTEKQKVEVSVRNRKIGELEEENAKLKADNIKLSESVSSKESTINEFQGLIKISHDKFAIFEETNQSLKNENQKLKAFIDDLQNKLLESKNNEKNSLTTIMELKNLSSEFARKEKELSNLLAEKDKRAQEVLIINENEIKQEFQKQLTMLEKSVEQYKLDNERLRMELRNSKAQYDGIEKLIHDKEMEFHRIVENKDVEYNNLLNTLREVQLSMQDLEMNFNLKLGEFHRKVKLMEENEQKLNKYLNDKEHSNKEYEKEIGNYKRIFENCQKSLIELNHQLKLKDDIIEKIKAQYNELLNELKEKEKVFKQFKISKDDELNNLIESFKELSMNKESLLEERSEIIRKNDILSKKVMDLTDILENKYRRVENEIYKERANRDQADKTNRELVAKLKEKDDIHQNEISKMRSIISNREREYEDNRNRLLSIIDQNKIKIEEQEHVKSSLVEELMMIKEWALKVEKQLKSKGIQAYSPLINYPTVVSNEHLESIASDSQKETILQLKEIINKIDTRLTGDVNHPTVNNDKQYN